MLFWIYIGAMFSFSAAGTIYFLSPQRRAGYERQYARYAHVSALLWSAIPLITGDGLWCIVMLPFGQGLARLAIAWRNHAQSTSSER
jgi:hypothetical protein